MKYIVSIKHYYEIHCQYKALVWNTYFIQLSVLICVMDIILFLIIWAVQISCHFRILMHSFITSICSCVVIMCIYVNILSHSIVLFRYIAIQQWIHHFILSTVLFVPTRWGQVHEKLYLSTVKYVSTFLLPVGVLVLYVSTSPKYGCM